MVNYANCVSKNKLTPLCSNLSDVTVTTGNVNKLLKYIKDCPTTGGMTKYNEKIDKKYLHKYNKYKLKYLQLKKINNSVNY